MTKNRGTWLAPGGLYLDPNPSNSMYFRCIFNKIDQLWDSISPQPLDGSFSNFKLNTTLYHVIAG